MKGKRKGSAVFFFFFSKKIDHKGCYEKSFEITAAYGVAEAGAGRELAVEVGNF